MAVPAHDERDNEFAKAYSLEVKEVVQPYFVFDGKGTPRSDAETVSRNCVDAIITDGEGNYLYIVEPGDELGHFVGGGLESGEDNLAALAREVAEEAGYTNILRIKEIVTVSALGYRIPKNINQMGVTTFYEVTVDRSHQTSNESDTDKHNALWAKRNEIGAQIKWPHHAYAWSVYQGKSTLWTDEGVLINSGSYDGMPSSDAREKIVADLAAKGIANEVTNYKLRDWSVGRQRYWGAPIPIINCEKCGQVLVPDDQLPVVLPELDDFQPNGDGRSALARATDWLKVQCPQCGGDAERETDTLDTYICSSWYMLRYLDPHNTEAPFGTEVANKWMPIDFYNGGDHATAHMMYARFMTRFFHKLGLLDNPEPFKKFLFNGKITAADGEMFSKSKGNGIDPLEIINQGYGADALRTYLMFAAPLDLWIRWDKQGVPGTFRFLNRVWNLVQEFVEAPASESSDESVLRAIHPAIKKVTADIEEQKYNTAIATMMKVTNDLYVIKGKSGVLQNTHWRFALESLVMLIAPFAPHTAEQLWQDLGHKDSVHIDHWPSWNNQYLMSDTITIVVQVNGKLRGQLQFDSNTSKDEIIAAARRDERVAQYVTTEPKKTIYVEGKLISFVV